MPSPPSATWRPPCRGDWEIIISAFLCTCFFFFIGNRYDSRRGLGIFLFTTASRTALGPTQPPMQWVPGALSLGVKRPGREADHSPLSSAEVKNAWSCTSTPQYVFMAWCLAKHTKTLPLPFTVWGTRLSLYHTAHLVTELLVQLFGMEREIRCKAQKLLNYLSEAFNIFPYGQLLCEWL
jgi:hypothetical protein